jgi:hypothetical protein
LQAQQHAGDENTLCAIQNSPSVFAAGAVRIAGTCWKIRTMTTAESMTAATRL